jgi:hypothetical protein
VAKSNLRIFSPRGEPPRFMLANISFAFYLDGLGSHPELTLGSIPNEVSGF